MSGSYGVLNQKYNTLISLISSGGITPSGEYVPIDGDATVNDIKTFTDDTVWSNGTVSTTLNSSTLEYATGAVTSSANISQIIDVTNDYVENAGFVNLTTNQDIGGIKTFTDKSIWNTGSSSTYGEIGMYRSYFQTGTDIYTLTNADGVQVKYKNPSDPNDIITTNLIKTGLSIYQSASGTTSSYTTGGFNLSSGASDYYNGSYEGSKYIGGSTNGIDSGTIYYSDQAKYGTTNHYTINGSIIQNTLLNQSELSQIEVDSDVIVSTNTALISDIIDSANAYSTSGGYVTITGTQTITGDKSFELFKVSDSGNTGNYTELTPTQLNLYTNNVLTVGGDIQNIIFAGNLQQSLGLMSLSGPDTASGTKTFTGQVSFESYAPHCDTLATFGNDLCTKAYVDAVVNSNTGSGLIFYLDQSMTSDITAYKTLTTTYYYGEPTVYLTTPSLGTNLISGFITDDTIPYVFGSPIAAGLFTVQLFAYVSTNTGQLNCYFTVNKYDTLTSTVTLLATSGNSSDINGTNSSAPDLYHMSCSVPETPYLSTDRMLILIYSTGTGMGSGATITTCFEGNYYSFVNTPISSGGNILTQNNNWTGTNNFTTTTTIPTAPTATSDSTAANCAYVQSNLTALTSSISSTYLTIASAASTYQTIAGMTSYLTVVNAASTYLSQSSAASTYQTLSGMSTYLTVANAASTYLTKSSPIVSSGNLTLVSGSSLLYGSGGQLLIGSTTNNLLQSTGLRIPKYLDGIDYTAGIFVGFNHTGGYLRSNLAVVCDGIGTASQLYTDYISPKTSDTGSITIGPSLTSGSIILGNVSQTGSITLASSPPSTDSTLKIATTSFVQSVVSPYLLSSVAAATYQPISGMSLYQTVAGMSSYLTIANASSTYQTISGMSSYLTTADASTTYLTITTAGTTYQTISGMSSYLTTATASSTYQTISGMSSYLTTSSASTTYLTIATASSTYQPISGMSSYLTTSVASSTYQTISGMSSYLTIASASSTYAPKANPTFSGTITTGDNILQSSTGSPLHLYETSTGSITIGFSADSISLGGPSTSSNSLYSNGTIYLEAPTLNCPRTINPYDTGDINLFNSTTGAIDFGGTASTLTMGSGSNVNIGTAGSGNINIGSNLLQSGNTNINGNIVNVGSTTKETVLSGSIISITSASSGGVINIGNSPSNTIRIGSSSQAGATVINSNSAGIEIASPMKPTYGLAALTSFNQIGYSYGTFTSTGYSNYSTGTTNVKFPSTLSPVPVQMPIGVYLINGWVSFNCSAGATAGVLTSLSTGYTYGSANTYNNTRQAVYFLENQSPIFQAANTSRTSSAMNYSWSVTFNNTVATNYIGIYALVNIGTAFTGGTVGANINGWQITRIA